MNKVFPILRPLSDLTKEIEHKGQKELPIRWIDENIMDFMVDHEEYNYRKLWYDIVNGYEKLNLFQSSKLFDYLYSRHFDVQALLNHGHGLIHVGLAININTLEI